jgi:hypothetical protein
MGVFDGIVARGVYRAIHADDGPYESPDVADITKMIGYTPPEKKLPTTYSIHIRCKNCMVSRHHFDIPFGTKLDWDTVPTCNICGVNDGWILLDSSY